MADLGHSLVHLAQCLFNSLDTFLYNIMLTVSQCETAWRRVSIVVAGPCNCQYVAKRRHACVSGSTLERFVAEELGKMPQTLKSVQVFLNR
ncbi:hypothetical protein GN958_ATG10569 [Phytophthora infestans]|uniref:Uncharacterized protein n=1 Tax=Phytophthora infestans TaxID=4787 RepID=A0A8S9UL54_PHYIN|nr:hypothetical protein GN958_ATG10569 [Phytophthora infestans]